MIKMFIKAFISFCFTSLFIFNYVFGQHDIAVDLQTGIPGYSIPVWSIQEHGINHNVSLTYTGSGLKSEDKLGSIGVGWKLNAGGAITREVKGLPDDFVGGAGDSRRGWLSSNAASGLQTFTSNSDNVLTNCNDVNEDQDFDIIKSYGLHDTEPDIFNFNAGGISFSFMFDASGVVRTIPYMEVRVQDINFSTTALEGFVVTTNDGIQYYFEAGNNAKKTVSNDVSNNTKKTIFKRDFDLYGNSVNFHSEWMLTKIVSPEGHEIKFGYLKDYFITDLDEGLNYTFEFENNTLEKIYSENFEIYTTLKSTPIIRGDIINPPVQYFPTWGLIKVSSKVGSVLSFIKQVNVDYFYTLNGSGTKDRRFVKSITQKCNECNERPYTFEYDGLDYSKPSVFPLSTSNGKDFWGFIKNSSSTGNPRIYIYPQESGTNKFRTSKLSPDKTNYVIVGDRLASADSYATRGSLKKITYPTGGNTSLTYELNAYFDPGLQDSVQGGGIRIRSISTNDGIDASKKIVRRFHYRDENNQSSGKLLNSPIYIVPKAKGHIKGHEDLKQELNAGTISLTDFWKALVYNSDHNLRIMPSSSPDVVYSRVEEKVFGEGSTFYEFNQAPDYFQVNNSSYSGTISKLAREKITSGTLSGRCMDPGILANGYAYFPYASFPNYEYVRGLPVKKSIYDEAGELRRTVDYEFDQISLNNDAPFAVKAMKFDRMDGRYFRQSGDDIYAPLGEMMVFGHYVITTDIKSVLIRTIEKNYDSNNSGSFVSSENTFHHDSPYHLNLTSQKNINSDGTTYINTYKYPLDYGFTNPMNSDNMVLMLHTLKGRFIRGLVVEELLKVKKSLKNEEVIGGRLNIFESFNGVPKISKVYNLRLKDGVLGFNESSLVQASNGSFSFGYDDDRYRLEQSIENYDPKGNATSIAGLQRTSGAVHKGFNHTVPILNIANAKAPEVAFSDFKNTGSGYNFTGTGTVNTTGRTDDKSYQLNSPSQYIEQNNVQVKKDASHYIFSCWLKSSGSGQLTIQLRNSSNTLILTQGLPFSSTAGKWKYYEVKLPINIVGTVKIKAYANYVIALDDVAFYPADADISYSSYRPLVGKTSETNSIGKTIYYVYDGDNTLKLIKDEEGNILERINREYANLTSGYGLFSSAETILKEGVLSEAAVDALTKTDKSTAFTYFDGLGRPIQQISKAASPLGNDLIQMNEYTLPGATYISYLPFSFSQTSGAFRVNSKSDQLAFYNVFGNDIATDIKPFAITTTDRSPLQNVLKQAGVGNDWQPGSGHEVQHNYRANTSADAVRLWQASGTSVSTYLAGALSVQEMIDENGNKVASFSDKMGRTILNRVTAEVGSDPFLDTYYIYDDFSRIKYSISPEAVSVMKNSGNWTVANTGVTELIFSNSYDDFGRLSEAKVPGKGITYYVYDNTDRLLLVQDGNQRLTKKWIYKKYDSRGNTGVEGIYTDNIRTTLAAMQSYVAGFNYDAADDYFEVRDNSLHGYSNNTFPQSNTDVLSAYYYDDYDFDRNGSADGQANFLTDGLYNSDMSLGQPRLLLTGEKKKVLAPQDQWLWSYYRYDDEGRLIQNRSNNHINNSVGDVATYLYDFRGKLLKNKVTKTVNAQSTIVQQEYLYDHAGRVLKINHQVDNNDPVLLAFYKYNELGQMVDKNLHATNTAGTAFMQSVDYRYNIRGWLTSINNAALSQGPSNNNDDEVDYFGMELAYNTGMGTGNTLQHNGNISAIKWSADLGLDAEKERVYNYTYDKTNRLKSAAYKNKTDIWNGAGGAFNVSNIQYDKNGNILLLNRKGAGGTMLDSLTYSYGTGTAKSNRLLSVTEKGNMVDGFKEGNTSGSDYNYDVNGNLTKDLNKGISAITYNHLNLPATITMGDGSIKYTYDATGVKLSQEVFNSSNELIKKIDYIGGIVYEDTEVQIIPHAEGRVLMKNHEGLGIFPEYQYYIKDHLGNVRTTFTSKPETNEFTATVESGTAIVAEESAAFDNYDDAVIVTNTIANHTPGGDKAIRLNATNTQIIGLAKSLKVYPGDKINMEVQAKFIKELAGANQTNVSALIGHAFMNAFGIVNSGETQQTYQFFSDFFSAGPVFSAPYDDGVPNAYLNYLLFDKDYNLMDAGFDPLTSAAQQPLNTSVKTPHELLELVANVTKEGYIYIYLSNENDMVNEVFFDDFKITHIESPVIQVADYYPFGLQHSTSWTRVNSVENNRLFNSGSELNKITGNYETLYRNYDPALGRFASIDPLAGAYSSWSPYNFALNDPVYWNDPNGDCPNCDGATEWLLLDGMYHQDGTGGGGYNGYGGSIGIGSGNHWSDQYRSVGGNQAMMSTSTFRSFYGVGQMSDRQKADFATRGGLGTTYTVRNEGQWVEKGWVYQDPGDTGWDYVRYMDYERVDNYTLVAQSGGNGDSYPNSVEFNEVQKGGIEMNEHFIGPALIALGQNIIESRGKFKEATPGTSIASKTLSKALPYRSPVIKKITTFLFGRQASTAVLGRALGRMVPGIGWAIAAIDVFEPYNPGPFFGGPSKSFSGQQLTYTPSLCFVEGTEILMGDGTKKNIEDVKVGDRVKTYNLTTSIIEEKEVLRIDSPIHFDIIDIGFSNDFINTNTFDHPYFIKEKGWCSYKPGLTEKRYDLKVKQLEAGDIAYFHNGKKLVEIKIMFINENIGKRQTYNLTEVESNNNFFANGVLVHNKYSPHSEVNEIDFIKDLSKPKKRKEIIKKFWKKK